MERLPSDQTFFGLTPEYDQRIMDQIFDLTFYGQGGFNFTELYQMPVNLRSYYYAKLAKILEERQKAAEAQSQKNQKGRRL